MNRIPSPFLCHISDSCYLAERNKLLFNGDSQLLGRRLCLTCLEHMSQLFAQYYFNTVTSAYEVMLSSFRVTLNLLMEEILDSRCSPNFLANLEKKLCRVGSSSSGATVSTRLPTIFRRSPTRLGFVRILMIVPRFREPTVCPILAKS